MSYTFTLSGDSSILSDNFNPPIYLDENKEYEVGLVNFDTFNSIPNVDEYNNILVWGTNNEFKYTVPVGAYEINELIKELEKEIISSGYVLRITPDIKTEKVKIKSNTWINFDVDNSIGRLLGFSRRKLEPNILHTSSHKVNILKINTICVDCNIAIGSFFNGQPVHIIHQFFPKVPNGYKIVEQPLTILYFPVNLKTINNITVRVLDQSGELINFNNEIITIRLHLKEVE